MARDEAAARSSAISAALDKSAVSRYIQLASVFRNLIRNGDWKVGEQIPTVTTLASEYGVAGMTIRQALDILEEEGLIDRFRAKGTFVKHAPETDLWCEVETDWNGLLLSREGAEITVLEESKKVPAPQYIENSTIGAAADRYRYLKRLHQRAGETFLYADVFIDEKVAVKIKRPSFSKISALRLVANVKGVKIADARQILTVDTADIELSERLNIALGDPVVNILRLAIDDNGTIVLAARGSYRGDRVRIDMKLMR
ncbi:MAG: GntR family transcriptional regulator [Gammaproteobacteria bacterium]|nr:GntR family transcriptional regulator [Gammaproteobacteria bacterium]